MKYADKGEYFIATLAGGDDRPIFVNPSRSAAEIKALYPEADVRPVTRDEFLACCERLKRVVML